MSETIQIKNINNYTIEIIDNTLILTPTPYIILREIWLLLLNLT